jgi:hypothetical protein
LHVLESPDGHTWTSRIDEAMLPGPWATDGGRIVMLQQRGYPPAASAEVWISDDGARTWREAAEPLLPDGFYPNSLIRGHGVYVVPGSWVLDGGDPHSAACVSADADAWQCNVIGELDGELAGRNWLPRQVAVTPTGFASLVEYFNDAFAGGDGSIEMILATSQDGLNWTFAPVPELKDKLPHGVAWTRHGLFSWGIVNRDITPDAPVPYLVLHETTLP